MKINKIILQKKISIDILKIILKYSTCAECKKLIHMKKNKCLHCKKCTCGVIYNISKNFEKGCKCGCIKCFKQQLCFLCGKIHCKKCHYIDCSCECYYEKKKDKNVCPYCDIFGLL